MKWSAPSAIIFCTLCVQRTGAVNWAIKFFLIVSGFSLAIEVTFELFRQMLQKQEIEAEKNKAELAMYKAQINPHFLYNTLQVIGGMALRKNAPEIYSVTTALGDILRYSLNFTDETVALGEELHYFESYLSIQKQRFGDKLHISIDVSKELNAAPVPKLILQPILENSFRHGLPDKEACWDISIKAVRNHGRLEITVADNGVGIPAGKLSELQEMLHTASYSALRSGRHIGLANVNMRIRLRDGGDPFGVDIQSVEGEGTVVQLVLRDRRGEEERDELHCSDN